MTPSQETVVVGRVYCDGGPRDGTWIPMPSYPCTWIGIPLPTPSGLQEIYYRRCGGNWAVYEGYERSMV